MNSVKVRQEVVELEIGSGDEKVIIRVTKDEAKRLLERFQKTMESVNEEAGYKV